VKVETGQGISEAGPGDRARLEPILEESFEGWYLRHSKRTLYEIGKVRVAEVNGNAVGLTMLKTVDDRIGYVYYIAVARVSRRMGFGGRLLDDALDYFGALGTEIVYAAAENEDALALFSSRGFMKTNFREVASRYGLFRAITMYRSMLVVPGEVLLQLQLEKSEGGTRLSSRA